jgi:hypothetical protein
MVQRILGAGAVLVVAASAVSGLWEQYGEP